MALAATVIRPPTLILKEANGAITNPDMNYTWGKAFENSEAINYAADNGCEKFVIFISANSNGIPKNNPKRLKDDIKGKISRHSQIDDLKFTRDNKIVITTSSRECALEVCKITNILNVNVAPTIQRNSITKRFLLRNIPVDSPLPEIEEELIESNNLIVAELRRFTKKSGETITPTELVLVTVLGAKIPDSIKLYYSFQKIAPFIDRPRQCTRCHRFDHPTKFCTRPQVCIRCGAEGSHDTCPGPISCPNCKQDHPADDKNCRLRIEEIKVLEFKERYNLSFAEARIRLKKKKDSIPSFADVTKISQETPDLEAKIQKAVDKIIGPTLANLTASITTLAEQQQKTAEALSNLLSQVGNIAQLLAASYPHRSPISPTSAPKKEKSLALPASNPVTKKVKVTSRNVSPPPGIGKNANTHAEDSICDMDAESSQNASSLS